MSAAGALSRLRLPAALFALAVPLLLLSLFLPWTMVHTGPFARSVSSLGYQAAPIGIAVLVLMVPCIRLLYLAPYGAGARVLAIASSALVLLGNAAAAIDIHAQALAHEGPEVYLAGYWLGWAAAGLLVGATALAFTLREE